MESGDQYRLARSNNFEEDEDDDDDDDDMDVGGTVVLTSHREAAIFV
jgi:hypothetical protein